MLNIVKYSSCKSICKSLKYCSLEKLSYICEPNNENTTNMKTDCDKRRIELTDEQLENVTGGKIYKESCKLIIREDQCQMIYYCNWSSKKNKCRFNENAHKIE